jgi:hypothetical protein
MAFDSSVTYIHILMYSDEHDYTITPDIDPEHQVALDLLFMPTQHSSGFLKKPSLVSSVF